jgi:hypothetical protein
VKAKTKASHFWAQWGVLTKGVLIKPPHALTIFRWHLKMYYWIHPSSEISLDEESALVSVGRVDEHGCRDAERCIWITPPP